MLGERQRDRVGTQLAVARLVKSVQSQVCNVKHIGPAGNCYVGSSARDSGSPHHAGTASTGNRGADDDAIASYRWADNRQMIWRVVDRGCPYAPQAKPSGDRY